MLGTRSAFPSAKGNHEVTKKKTKTTTAADAAASAEAWDELREELKGELPTMELEDLSSDLSCAEQCETVEDMRANLQNAIDNAVAVERELRELLGKLEGGVS